MTISICQIYHKNGQSITQKKKESRGHGTEAPGSMIHAGTKQPKIYSYNNKICTQRMNII